MFKSEKTPGAKRLAFDFPTKAMIGAICGVLLLVFFFVQIAVAFVNTDKPQAIEGTCSLEYVETTLIPISASQADSQEDDEELIAAGEAIFGDVEKFVSQQNTLPIDNNNDSSIPSDTVESADLSNSVTTLGQMIQEQVEGEVVEPPIEQAPSFEGQEQPFEEFVVEQQEEFAEPLAASESSAIESNSNMTVERKNTYLITMPDGENITAYGTTLGYIPKNGKYSFVALLQSDGTYTVSVDTVYEINSAAEISPSAGEGFSGAGLTQQIDKFSWAPSKNVSTLGVTVHADSNEIIGTEQSEDEEDNSVANQSVVFFADNGDTTGEFPMEISAVSVDSVTRIHEGCIADEVTIDTKLEYSNLISGQVYSVVAYALDASTKEQIMNIDGAPVTIGIEIQVNNEDALSPDENTTIEKFNSLLEATRSLQDAYSSMSPEQQGIYAGALSRLDGLPDKLEAAASGDVTESELSDIAACMTSMQFFYDFLPADVKSSLGQLPEYDEVEQILSQVRSARRNGSYASGDTIFSLTMPGAAVAGKDVIISIEIISGESVFARLDGSSSKQSVRYPLIATEATVNGLHDAAATNATVIVDTVQYTALTPNVRYHLEMTVIDKESGQPIVDADTGNPVSQLVEFVPEYSTGTINAMTAPFNAIRTLNRHAVVFEKLYRCPNVPDESGEIAINASAGNSPGVRHSAQDEALVAVHEDIDDVNQTIDFTKLEWSEEETELPVPLASLGANPVFYVVLGLLIFGFVIIGIARMRSKNTA